MCIKVTAVRYSNKKDSAYTIIEDSKSPADNCMFYSTVQDSKLGSVYMTSSAQMFSFPPPPSETTTFTPTMPTSRNTLNSGVLVGVLVRGSLFISVVLILLLVGITIITVIRRS